MLGVTAPTGARTITSVRLVIIPAPDLRAMIQAEPRLGTAFLEHALTSLRTQTLDTCHLKLRSAVQRLASFLIGLAEGSEMNPARFVLPYEKRFLAARIGCTQENLSRAFAALRRLGVETQRGAVVLRDVEALRAYAGLASVRKAA
jgi:CRP/FNR family transcriptional activator FtrB